MLLLPFCPPTHLRASQCRYKASKRSHNRSVDLRCYMGSLTASQGLVEPLIASYQRSASEAPFIATIDRLSAMGSTRRYEDR